METVEVKENSIYPIRCWVNQAGTGKACDKTVTTHFLTCDSNIPRSFHSSCSDHLQEALDGFPGKVEVESDAMLEKFAHQVREASASAMKPKNGKHDLGNGSIYPHDVFEFLLFECVRKGIR